MVNLHFIIYMGGKGINGLFALIGHLTITSATYQQPQNLHMRINDKTFHCISSAVIFYFSFQTPLSVSNISAAVYYKRKCPFYRVLHLSDKLALC